ncbi:MAG TPA: hypothetical protein VFL86_06815 [Burkholderiaceae bacterium]|nr:hypothetical protein [Burkholderiaceae bacterium]
MIQLIDKVDCDALQKSIVRPEAIKRAILVQDAGTKDDLFALLMVCDKRAVLVTQGVMSLHAGTVSSKLKMQAFRTLLDKADVRTKELRFCSPGTYKAKSLESAEHFDPEWFVKPTFVELVARFSAWRAGRAVW